MGWNYRGFGWYRAGYPWSNIKFRDRFGKHWFWIGPWVIGDIRRF